MDHGELNFFCNFVLSLGYALGDNVLERVYAWTPQHYHWHAAELLNNLPRVYVLLYSYCSSIFVKLHLSP